MPELSYQSHQPSNLVADLRRKMAGTGHDLMQPLQIVSHALHRMGNAQLDARDRMWIDAAIAQAERIAGGLSDLIAHSVAVPEPHLSAIPLGPLLDEMANAWSATSAAAGVRLRVMPSAESVVSNRDRLCSVINNLIVNAIKYSPAGRVIVGVRRCGEDLAIDVVDNGCGIADHDHGRIFQAFCQIRPAAPGVGLGLSLVREHCSALGHQIELSSQLGRGSRFRLRLGRRASLSD